MISHNGEAYTIFDAHTHFAGDSSRYDVTLTALFDKLRGKYPFHLQRVGRDPSTLVQYLDRVGVDVVCVLAEEGPPTNYSVDCSFILGYAAQAPHRVLPIGNINHRIETSVEHRVRGLIVGGIRGFKQYYADHNQNPYEDRLTPLYELCSDHRLPILFHCGTHSRYYMTNHQYGEPLLYERLFEKYPDIPFVMCHGGKGGHHEQCVALLRAHPNTYIEISDISRSALEWMCPEDLAERFLFGTDMPQFPDYGPLVKIVFDLPLSAPSKHKIFHDNAARIFGLGRPHVAVSALSSSLAPLHELVGRFDVT